MSSGNFFIYNLDALLEVKGEAKVALQIFVFPQEEIYTYPNGEKLLEKALKMRADIVGDIPHYEFTKKDVFTL